MIRALPSKLRFATGLGAVALLALPLAAQAADYRGQLSEALSSGSPGVSANLSLTATIDNGSGGVPATTGSVRFAIDARHLSPTVWPSLMAAPPGTQLGTVKSEIAGAGAMPLRVQSHARDAIGPYVGASVEVPRDVATVIGSSSLPVAIRPIAAGKQIAFMLDIHTAVGKLTAAHRTATVQKMTLSLASTIAFAGQRHPVTLNPLKDTALTNVVTVRACAQPACTTLRPVASVAGATVHLPKQVTVQAPDTATYGYRYSISGVARPGDQVTLQGLSNDGLVAAHGSASVRTNGQFIIRATLRSAFSDDGDLALPAAGRYAVASTEGGNATVYGIATQDTRVSLAQPRFVLKRKPGGKLHFAVRVPGADRHVRVTIKLGHRTLVKGFVNERGRFFKTIVKPSDKGNLRVVASVPGADTAISVATPLSQ